MPMRLGQSALRTQTIGLRQRAWWVMRRHGVFTLPELLATVADGGEKDAASNLGHYLRALAKAGILSTEGRAAPEKPTSNGCLRYRLAVDCGRKAPVWRASRGEVYDPNAQIAYPMEAGHV